MTEKHTVQSKDDLKWRHHIAHHTFLPAIGVMGLVVLSSPVAWWYDYVSLGMALAIPWIAFLGICLWLIAFGDFVMPAESYRKYKSGEWG